MEFQRFHYLIFFKIQNDDNNHLFMISFFTHQTPVTRGGGRGMWDGGMGGDVIFYYAALTQ